MPRSSQDFYNKILGAAGENRAAEYLKKQGLKILKRNYKTPFGEADIVAQDGETVVFVEVKTRTNEQFSTPAAAVNKAKQRRYVNIARYYEACAGREVYVRFDVMELLDREINYIKDAFRA